MVLDILFNIFLFIGACLVVKIVFENLFKPKGMLYILILINIMLNTLLSYLFSLSNHISWSDIINNYLTSFITISLLFLSLTFYVSKKNIITYKLSSKIFIGFNLVCISLLMSGIVIVLKEFLKIKF